jgi:hypothetical protein
MPDGDDLETGTLKTIGPAIVRTAVPYLVGWFVSWGASRGITVDQATQVNLMTLSTMVLGTLYYSVIRAIEKNHPKAGWLLGAPHAPVYPTINGGTPPPTPDGGAGPGGL